MKNNIRDIRKARHMTLEQLALKLGTGPRTIQRFELEERDMSLRWVQRIAKALDCTPNDLLSETEGGWVNNTTTKADDAPHEELVFWIVELCAQSARNNPQLPKGVMGAIGKTVYRAALTGKLPDIKPKPGSKTPPKSLANEAMRLIEYEIAKLN